MAKKACFIIDDDSIVHYITNHLFKLNFSSWMVEGYFNGLDALNALYQAGKMLPHLILLDINMPVMNGWEFLSKLQENPSMKIIPIVIVSSSVDPRDKEKAEKFDQVIQFVHKPITKEEINKVMQKATQIRNT